MNYLIKTKIAIVIEANEIMIALVTPILVHFKDALFKSIVSFLSLLSSRLTNGTYNYHKTTL